MRAKQQKTIALTMGDPAGIGPEIVVKAILQPEVRSLARVVVFGDIGILRKTAVRLGARVSFKRVGSPEELGSAGRSVGVVAPRQALGLREVRPGRTGPACGAAAFGFLEAATKAVLAGQADALVTAPVCKQAMWEAGYRYEGQTQILSEICRVRRIGMVLIRDPLRVMLLTRHLPLRKAIEKVKKRAVLQMVRLACRELEKLGVRSPRIAVAGLNPHAGENRLFGVEEAREIAPAVEAGRAEGIAVSGPYPPDTVFQKGLSGAFDIILALYHDQGMIPVKTLGIGELVVWVAGLPIIRTSVGHGTAFDIAGKGKADPRSLQAALLLAVSMAGPGR